MTTPPCHRPPVGLAHGLARIAIALSDAAPNLADTDQTALHPIQLVAEDISLWLLTEGDVVTQDTAADLTGVLSSLEALSLFTLLLMEDVLSDVPVLNIEAVNEIVAEAQIAHFAYAASDTDIDIHAEERSAASAALWTWSRELSSAADCAGRAGWVEYLETDFMRRPTL